MCSSPYRLLVITASLISIMLSASVAWTPSYLVEAHNMTTGEVGSIIGLFRGPAGIIGALLGGFLTTYLARKDHRWLYRVPAIALACACPAQLLLLYSNDIAYIKLGLALENFFSTAQIGPLFALVISVTTARTRAVAISILLLSMNIIGQSLGPIIVGVLNDLMTDVNKAEALRFGLTLTSTSAVLAGIFCILSGRKIEKE